MKHLIKLSLVILVFAAMSCAQKKENREEFKSEHSVEQKRVDGTAPAAVEGEPKPTDSIKAHNILEGN